MRPVDYDAQAGAYSELRRVDASVFAGIASAVDSTDRVLEVGCGTGNYICQLAASVGCECFGVDPSPGMLAKLSARGCPVTTSSGRAEALAFPDGGLDVLYSVDVIHHVSDRPHAFREAFRVLKPGGRVCTVTDSEWMIRNRDPQMRFFPEAIPIELARYPTIESIESDMSAAGFESLRQEVTETPYLLSDPTPYREKVFSSLLYLDDETFARGLARLEAALGDGPLHCVSRYVQLWGTKPPS